MKKHFNFYLVILLALLIALFSACDDGDGGDDSDDIALLIAALAEHGITLTESDFEGLTMEEGAYTNDDNGITGIIHGSVSVSKYENFRDKMDASTTLSALTKDTSNTDAENLYYETEWKSGDDIIALILYNGNDIPHITINYDED